MTARVAPGIEQLRPYVAGKPAEELARERGITDVTKLASNENAIGASPRVHVALMAALSAIHRYPDSRVHELRGKLGEHYGIEPEQLVFGNGSNELIELLVRTFCVPGDHLVFAEPSFVVYRSAALAAGVDFSAVPLVRHTHDLEAMRAAVRDETRLVFIANPNNPTGTHVGQRAVLDLLDALPPEVLVVLDEAYVEYVDAEDYPRSVPLLSRYPNLVLLRTFSKAYGLAGLRIGYGLCSAELTGYLNRVRAPFNANTLAQVAAIAALEDQEHLRQVVELNRSERARLLLELAAQRFAGRGLVATPSQANFVLVHFKQPAAAVHEALLQRGLITRPVGMEHALRITIGLPEENDRLLRTLEEIL